MSKRDEFIEKYRKEKPLCMAKHDEVVSRYIEALNHKTLLIDTKGHWSKKRLAKKFIEYTKFIFSSFYMFTKGDDPSYLQELITLLDNPSPDNKYIEFFNGDLECPKCGGRFNFKLNGHTLTIYDVILRKKDKELAPCVYKDGLPEITTTIDCPSGKMVFTNDLRTFFTDEEIYGKEDNQYGDEFDINTFVGTNNTSVAYAKVGMGHFFAGSGGADTYKKGNMIKIVKGNHEEDTYESVEQEGSIHMALWWVSFADYELLKKRDEKALNEMVEDTYETHVIDVTPGTYKLTSNYHNNPGQDKDGNYIPIEVVTIERIK